jgi:integrase
LSKIEGRALLSGINVISRTLPPDSTFVIFHRLSVYRLHDNRHTHASHLVSSGLSLEIVGRLLGHTNPTTTKRYAHIADNPLRAATERFGAKLDALHKDHKAEIIPLKLPR